MVWMRDKLVNQDDLSSTLRREGVSGCRVRTKFLEDSDFQINHKLDMPNDESFVKEVIDKISDMAEKLPHNQIVLNIKMHDTVVEVSVNPVTGAA